MQTIAETFVQPRTLAHIFAETCQAYVEPYIRREPYTESYIYVERECVSAAHAEEYLSPLHSAHVAAVAAVVAWHRHQH